MCSRQVKAILFSSAAASFFVFAAADHSTATLIHHYTFDSGDATDSVGSNDLIASDDDLGGSNLVFAGGFASNSGASAQTGTSLEVGAPLNFGSDDDWSLAFFVRDGDPNDNVSFDGIVSSNTGGGPNSWQVDIRSTGTRDIGEANGNNVIGNIGDGEFHHVAVVHDSTAAGPVAYFDGVLSGITWPTARDQIANLVVFRNRNDGNTQYFNGDIDDLRIYDHALSAAEVATLVPEPNAFVLCVVGSFALACAGRSSSRPVSACPV